MITIRHATLDDLEVLAAIEDVSYPAAEGASRESIKGRLQRFADCFWVAENDKGQAVSFINGLLTNEKNLVDEMFDRPEMHDPNGGWLMIFSVATNPEQRGRGYAGALLRRAISDLHKQNRQGIVLTCKEKLLGFYAQFGFVNEGISQSTHGNASWYQMRLVF